MENIIETEYSEEMRRSYIDYAMSVIVARALPDIRDGLKPVQRRTLYDMRELGLKHDQPYRKCARIVGDTMGKYHPHGDCLDGQTKVRLVGGAIRTLEKLYDLGTPKWIYAVDESTGDVVPAMADDFRIGQYADKIYHITLSTGVDIQATGNHPFLLASGGWIKAEQIQPGMALDAHAHICRQMPEGGITVQRVEIETLSEPRPMYDFTVDGLHNMLICADGDCEILITAHNSSIYDSLVVMSQGFKKGYPLVDGHGNFGSIEGDGAAAMRYTEARLEKFTEEAFLSDLDKHTVDFVPNFDETEKEPAVLPVRVPNFLINGSEGIAVGMATSTPPHNLSEALDAEIAYLKDPKITVDGLMEHVKGPDFPTGGIVVNRSDLPAIYGSGTGKIRIRGKVEVEAAKGGKKNLVITEIPYTMIGSGITKFMQDVAALASSGKAPDITDISNQSSKEGMRIVVECRKGADTDYLKNLLFAKTKLEDTFGVNMLAVSNGRPETLGLKDAISLHADHLIDVNTRLYRELLRKDQEKAEIQEGLIRACGCIDLVIAILRGSKTKKAAMDCLVHGKTDGISFKTKTEAKNASKLCFTEAQASSILDMRLYRLIGLEIEALMKEQEATLKRIGRYKKLLADKKMLVKEIIKDLERYKKEYGRPRRTEIRDEGLAAVEEKPMEERDLVIMCDRFGYIKAMDLQAYDRNKEAVEQEKWNFTAKNTDKILAFTAEGNLHSIKVADIPIGKLRDKGIPIDNISSYDSAKERIVYMVPLKGIKDDKILFVTASGNIKAVAGKEFDVSKRMTASTKLASGDSLAFVSVIRNTASGDQDKMESKDSKDSTDKSGKTGDKEKTDKKTAKKTGQDAGLDVVLHTDGGIVLRFSTDEVPGQKKAAVGSRAIKLKNGESVDGAWIVCKDDKDILLADGTRVPLSSVKKGHRDTRGNKI